MAHREQTLYQDDRLEALKRIEQSDFVLPALQRGVRLGHPEQISERFDSLKKSITETWYGGQINRAVCKKTSHVFPGTAPHRD